MLFAGGGESTVFMGPEKRLRPPESEPAVGEVGTDAPCLFISFCPNAKNRKLGLCSTGFLGYSQARDAGNYGGRIHGMELYAVVQESSWGCALTEFSSALSVLQF